MDSSSRRIETVCAHAGALAKDSRERNAPYIIPITQTTLFELGSSEAAEAVFSGQEPGFTYTRFGNPTVQHLADVIAQLEGGADAFVTASGNAASACALTAALRGTDDCIVSHPDIYGGTLELLHLFSERYRVPVAIVDPADRDAWQAAIARASVVFVETPSNPLLRLIDLEDTAHRSHAAGARLIVDNTIATPFNQHPFQFGADWIVHSVSKYLNGHSDVIGGCLVSRASADAQARAIHKNLGGTVNALDAWLMLRGLRTFAMRMETHNRNGTAVAAWLCRHPAVSKVYYPGLPDHPQSGLFERQMRGGGGLLSFELAGGKAAAERFLDRVKLVVHAVSLGGMESLATRPSATSHRGLTPEARQAAGVADSLIRLSVGVEAIEDLLADLDQALG